MGLRVAFSIIALALGCDATGVDGEFFEGRYEGFVQDITTGALLGDVALTLTVPDREAPDVLDVLGEYSGINLTGTGNNEVVSDGLRLTIVFANWPTGTGVFASRPGDDPTPDFFRVFGDTEFIEVQRQ